MKSRYSSINAWRNIWRTLPLRSPRSLVWFAGLAAIAYGCFPEPTPPESQSFVITAAPEVQEIAQGSSVNYTITVQRTGFTGPVTLTVGTARISDGVSVTITPRTIPSGQTTAVATLSLAPNAVLTFDGAGLPIREEIPIFAIGEGNRMSDANLVYAPKLSSQAGITINATPATIVMNAGETSDATVTIARQGNYAGQVTMSVPAAIGGISATLTPIGTTPDAYRLRFVTAQTGVTTGTPFTFTITAAPEGLPKKTVGVLVLVSNPIFSPSVLHATRMRANESDTVTVLLGRGAGFRAPIVLSLDSGRTGLTGTFAPNPAVDDASLLTIRAASDVPAGDYKVRVRGIPQTGSGAEDGLTRVTVTVDPVAVSGTYTISVPSVTVVAGANASGTLTVNRGGGFAEAVTVALIRAGGAALPVGLSIVLDQNPITQMSTTMRVATTAATPEGTYAFVATGTSPGSANATANFNVVVNTAPRVSSITVGKLVSGVPQATTSETLSSAGSVSLIPVVLDQNGQPMISETVTWSSANTGIAAVNGLGVVTAIASGTTTVTATSNTNATITASVAITVSAAPVSVVARVELEPGNAEITAPATQQYVVSIYNAAGARTTGDAGGSFEYTSSNPAVATINATSGLATGVSAGTTTITVKYLRSGVLIKQDASTLTVYAVGSVNHYGSATISTNNNNIRTMRAGESLLFQIIVRDVTGVQRTSGVTPPPVVSSSNTSVMTITSQAIPDGYFFNMNSAANAVAGTTVKIRYDVMGAGGEIVITIVP